MSVHNSQPVHADERVAAWRAARREAGRLLVAVDFDGTLAPIVDRPADAAILPAGRAALAALAARPDTAVAVVSGRGLADVRARVDLDRLHYAGNHGMEIDGPDVSRVHPEAEALRPALAALAAELRGALAGVEGAIVEDKGLTLSVHYRMVSDAGAAERVRRETLARGGGVAGLRTTEGKKVVEVRPDVDWDKGRATRFLLDALLPDRPAGPCTLFIGDDATDEDAFRALGGDGEGVLVAAAPPPDTAARCWVRSPAEVATLLERLAAD